MTANDQWKRLQEEKPFLGGAIFGLILSIALVVSDLIFQGETNLVVAVVMTPLTMLSGSLLMGLSAKSRKKRSG